jgi:hypothetical protein
MDVQQKKYFLGMKAPLITTGLLKVQLTPDNKVQIISNKIFSTAAKKGLSYRHTCHTGFSNTYPNESLDFIL